MTRKHEDALAKLGLRPQLDHDLPTLLHWLSHQGLTYTGPIFDRPADEFLPVAGAMGESVAVAQSANRQKSRPRTRQELKDLKERFKKVTVSSNPEQWWAAVRDIEGSVRTLDWSKLPADAMAFYRPFHFPPIDQWGIYILINPLLSYHQRLVRQSDHLKLFSREVLMHLILFEVFNHEFFHHLVESTATTLEVLLASQGAAQSVYLRHRVRQALNDFRHPHCPLEEALANAYAYNALSFICRIKAGFKTVTVEAYQKALKEYWQREPAGYREAGHYIQGDYVAGGAHLLAHLLAKPRSVDEVPLSVVAKHVMPGGFTALRAKPDIPTWLVGSETELALFNELVPAPNEAYTQLFWPYNTDDFDQFIEKKLADEKARKTAQKFVRRSSAQ
ncbi:MAG: hypothetical protein WD688_23010 [Candidatus Binatia bacterium]